MIKVLSYLNVQDKNEVDGVQFYRQVAPLQALTWLPDFEVKCLTEPDLMKIVRDGDDNVLSGFDIYAYPRMVHGDCEEFLDKIHSDGGQLVIDADDDLTEDYRLVSGHGDIYKETLGMVDYVICSTQALADRLAPLTTFPPYVCRNHVNVEWMQRVVASGERIVGGLTVGFSGSPTHWGDWYVPSVAYQRICRDYKVVALLHGEMPSYMFHTHNERVEMEGVPYYMYPAALSQFDILLCAVDANDRFNDGKSNVKALEAMAVGAVPVCSDFPAYNDLAADGAPIIIAEHTHEGWYSAIASLLDSPRKLKELKEAGSEYVQRHDIKIGVQQWADTYREIYESNPYASRDR